MKYKIEGGNLPVVICELEAGETLITEGGAMSWMSPNIRMETTSNGGVGKALGRMFSGEKLFQNRYTAVGGGGMIAFASSFPGSIRAFEIGPGNELICQKGVFLAGEESVDLSVYLNKKLGKGLFGGEGFIMQRFEGSGMVFLEIDGSVITYDLQAGQSMLVDTGYLAAMTEGVSIDIESVKGIGNKLFGGEGFFNTKVTGPGRIWLQTMPASAVAAAINPFITTAK